MYKVANFRESTSDLLCVNSFRFPECGQRRLRGWMWTIVHNLSPKPCFMSDFIGQLRPIGCRSPLAHRR